MSAVVKQLLRPVENEFTNGPLTIQEVIKIISLLENPPEADMVRKALRFYAVPERLLDHNAYTWGENKAGMEVLFHYESPQDKTELAWLLEHVRGKRSLLEIGSSFGGTLRRMASVMPKGSRIVSVDLPIDSTPQFLNPLASLKDTCRQIGLLGAQVELFVGNSHNPEVIEAVRKYGPFEFAFIDGDHSYDGVKQDWENYGPMCKVVAFHDVHGPVRGCATFWHELKATKAYRTEESVGPGVRKFGIGIVYRDSG